MKTPRPSITEDADADANANATRGNDSVLHKINRRTLSQDKLLSIPRNVN